MAQQTNHKKVTSLFSSPVLQQLKQDLARKQRKVVITSPKIDKKIYKRRKIKIDNLSLYAHDKLRKFAYETPPGIIDKRTVKRIRKSLPAELTEKFPQIIDELFEQLHDEFGKCIRDTAAEQKIQPCVTLLNSTLRRNEGKLFQTNYTSTQMQMTKLILKSHLFITSPLFRVIHKKSIEYFPESLINYTSYREDNKCAQLAVLRARLREDLESAKQKSIQALLRDIFPQLRSGVFLKNINPQIWYQYLQAIRYFINLRIMELLHRTTENFVNTIGDPKTMPLIKFNISLSDTLDMSPKIKQISNFYHNMIDTLGTHSFEIPPMTKIQLSNDFRKVNVEIPDYVTQWAHSQMDIYLREIIQPVQEYLDYLESEYSCLWNPEFIEEITNYNIKEHRFSECCEKVKYLRDFKNRITIMLPNKYFKIGTASQIDMIESLRRKIDVYMENLLEQLVQKNYIDNINICDEFSNITAKATKIPNSTQELVEMATFMTWAKTKRISDLQEKVMESLLEVCDLIEMSTITDDHMRLNVQTIVWSEKITSIVEENTAMYEQRKNELEEDLQRHIDDLTKTVQNFIFNLQILDEMSDCDNAGSYIYHLKKMILTIGEFDILQSWINKEETLFKFPMSVFPDLEECKEIIFTFTDLVCRCFKWLRTYSVWMDGPWENLTYETVRNTLNSCDKEFQNFHKMYTTKIRQQIADSYTRRFKGQVDDPDIHNHPAPLRLCFKALQYIKSFQPNVDIVRILGNPALLSRHWDEMSEIVGYDITPDAGTTLRKMVKQDFQPHLEKFEIISLAAMKELKLQENLHQMKREWAAVFFETISKKEVEIKVLNDLESIHSILDDHIDKTLIMRGSVFVKPAEEEVRDWYKHLIHCKSITEKWFHEQNNWLELIPILTCEHITSELPNETNDFQILNKLFREFLTEVHENDNVHKMITSVKWLKSLDQIENLSQTIYKGVHEFIEEKRLFFPRFFFLSNSEILQILRYSECFKNLELFIRKCFQGIHTLQIENSTIIAMKSATNEQIKFVKPINIRKLSVWRIFFKVEEQMRESTREDIYRALQDYQFISRTKWLQKWPQQVILTVAKVYWTKEMETCLRSGNVANLENYRIALVQQLNELTRLQRSTDISTFRKNLFAVLYVQEVHHKSIIEKLYQNRVTDLASFDWIIQLRNIWNQHVIIHIFNISRISQYEYLGNSEKLVQTPLSERCYRALIMAFQFQLCGTLIGCHVSGKTEMFKDIARAFAVQSVWYNCYLGYEYRSILRFVKGLACSGAWLCFDDIDYVDSGILSVITQQLLSITQGIKSNSEQVMIENYPVKLNINCFACITINSKYAFSTLPENFKMRFRHFFVTNCDTKIICETILLAHGFERAKVLTRKIITLYNFLSTQLLHHNYYDFQIRAIKNLLKISTRKKLEDLEENEDKLIKNTIFELNLPILHSRDIQVFENYLNDIFPGVECQQSISEDFLSALQKACEKFNLQLGPCLAKKLHQLHTTQERNHATIITGKSYAGKTTSLKILAHAENLITDKKIEMNVIYPKVLTHEQIFGKFQFHSGTRTWIDGICPKLFRKLNSEQFDQKHWLIFDGPLENAWMKILHPLFDVNKSLYLKCGQEISLPKNLSLIFEVENLEKISPNITSTCGIVHIDAKEMGWERIFTSWIRTANQIWSKNNEQLITDLFDWIMTACLAFSSKKCAVKISLGETHLVKSALGLFDILLTDACIGNMEDIKNITSWIQATLCIVILWTFTGIIDSSSTEQFDQFYKDLWRNRNDQHRKPDSIVKVDVVIPSEGFFVDYFYVYKGKGVWKYFPDITKSPKIEDINLEKMIVPTVDAARQSLILDMHVRHSQPFLLIGNSGCGKSKYVENILLNKVPTEQFQSAFVQITQQMNAKQTQQLLLSKSIKYNKNLYGASENKTLSIFVDDLHICLKDDIDPKPPLELIRQYYDHKFWYDVKDNTKITIKNVLFLIGMGLIGGSLPNMCQRFLRHFSVYVLPDIGEENVLKIFSCVLFHALKNNGFPPDIMANVQSIVQASFVMYTAIRSQLKPTPRKYLCSFILKDFERVIIGCSLLVKDTVENKKVFPKLWIHEILRVFSDRLVDREDYEWLCSQLHSPLEEHFKENLKDLFDYLPKYDDEITMKSLEHLYFGNFQNEHRRYEEIPDEESLMTLTNTALERLNFREKVKLDIVFQHYSLQHFIRICRIISTVGCNGLLIGAEGSGRESLIRLAASSFEMELYQPKIIPGYGFQDWRNDVKNVLLQAGGLGKKIIFVLKEYHITSKEVLDDINSLLTSSDIPNMYSIDEYQRVLEKTRISAQRGDRSLDVSISDVMEFFVNRCRENLHIFVCFSAKNSVIRNRLRLHPAFMSTCSVDWFARWPAETYIRIANRYISTLTIPQDFTEPIATVCHSCDVVVKNMSDTFYMDTRRVNRITSASYIDFLKSYQDLICKKQSEIMKNKQKYQIGLDKLLYATEQVVLLQEELAKLKPQLLIMGQRSAAMRKEIEHETIAVEKASFLVREEEKVANVHAAAAQELKSECEADLALAIPILEDAIAALNTLKPTDITLVKSMKNPPDTIKLVMAAVCVMKDIKPDRLPDAATGRKIIDYWGPSKKILGEMNFLQQLKEFDKDDIPPPIMVKIRKEYLPNKDFQPHIVAKASSAAEGLCKWVIAMDLYDKVAKEVAPKKAKLMIAESTYATTLGVLNEKRLMLSQLEDRLATLNLQLAKANADMRRVQIEVDHCTKKYQCAQRLVNSLEGDKSYWSDTVSSLQTAYDSLVGNMLLSAGNVAYLGPFSPKYRKQIITKWMEHFREFNLPFSEDFDVVPTLKERTSNEQIAELNGFVISENIIILKNAKRRCLFIDPQLEINHWLKFAEAKNNLKVLKLTDSNFIQQIETSVKIGTPILIENVGENLDISLDPFLTQKTYEADQKKFIILYGNQIEFHPDFRLYLTTTLQNPKYPPHVFHKVAVIYSPISETALVELFLDTLIEKENHSLHTKRKHIVFDAMQHKLKLKAVRQHILKTLCDSQTNILEDVQAIETLDQSKVALTETIQIQIETIEKQNAIEILRKQYEDVAKHGTAVYSCLLQLFFLNIMYQYSLKWYLNVFKTAIETASRSKYLQTRIKNVMKNISKTVFHHVYRSLYEKDKLIFCFMLLIETQILRNLIEPEIFNFFTTGKPTKAFEIMKQPELITSPEIWNNICYLNTFKDFEGICESFQNPDTWTAFIKNYEEPLPDYWNKNLSNFNQIILFRLFHPECVIDRIKSMIAKELGIEYVTPIFYDISEAYHSSNFLWPIVILTTPGTSTVGPLINFARQRGFTSNFKMICLGTDSQNQTAQELIEAVKHLEHWICIQNCHLAPKWMRILERIFEQINPDNTNTEFRIWITTAPSNAFPVSILQNSTKVTSDTLTGLREGLLSCYHSDILKNTDYYQKCPGKDKIFHKAIYGLCFYHVLVQRRQNFDRTKWNIPVKFDYFDLKIALELLVLYTNESEYIPFKLLHDLIGDCIYNGKIYYQWDRSSFLMILQELFNESLIEDERYTFCSNDIRYRLPRKLEYIDVLNHIDRMAINHPAEIYKLNSNAEVTLNIQRFNNFLHDVQAMTSNLPLKRIHEYKTEIIEDIFEKLPNSFDISLVIEKYPKSHENPFHGLLINEVHLYNDLLQIITNDLKVLKNAITGETLITSKLTQILSKLQTNSVPENWLRLSQGPVKIYLGCFLKYTSERINFFIEWIHNTMPNNFWLSAFIYPKKLFVTFRQHFSKTTETPLNDVHLDYFVTSLDEDARRNPETLCISGLYIFGARWDDEICALNEQLLGLSYVQFPSIVVTFTQHPNNEKSNRFECPILHKSFQEQSQIFTECIEYIRLETVLSPTHWIQRNVFLEPHFNFSNF